MKDERAIPPQDRGQAPDSTESDASSSASREPKSSDWFETAFGSFYAELYAHRDEGEVDRLLHSLAPVLPSGGPILDLACGAGRLLRPLAKRYGRAYGVDLSMELLRMVGPLSVARADMRQLPLARRTFGAVLSLFTSFGYFSTEEEDRAVFADMAALLRADGVLVLDFLNAEVVLAGLRARSVDRIGDREVESRRSYDAKTRILEKKVRVERDGLLETSYAERVRIYDPEALAALFRENGLTVESIWGDYDGNEFAPAESQRCLLVGRRDVL